MIERILIIAALTALFGVGILATRWYTARRIERVLEQPPGGLWESLGQTPDGRRTLVTFSTPSCAACHRAQAPAVNAVEAQLGAEAVRIIKIDTAEQPEVARAFGVLTVPSTVVLAAEGHAVAVNQGFTPAATLVQQLQVA
jgi:thioredoxin-like negative regulator of GroEL